MKILIIEDDVLIREELQKLLLNYDYDCQLVTNFERVVETVLEAHADLLLLDINLPFVDGYHVCREVRRQSEVPIIVVTSRNTQMDELMSMNLGADDFITKPYNKQILLARISAVLSRTQRSAAQETMHHKGLDFNISKGVIAYEGQEITLTKNEQQLFHMLMKHSGGIVTRSALMEDLWQTDNYIDDNTLTVNMNRLRKKLESVGASNFIVTKRGRGYMV